MRSRLLKLGDEETIIFSAKNIEGFGAFDDFDALIFEKRKEVLEILAVVDIGAQKDTRNKLWVGFIELINNSCAEGIRNRCRTLVTRKLHICIL